MERWLVKDQLGQRRKLLKLDWSEQKNTKTWLVRGGVTHHSETELPKNNHKWDSSVKREKTSLGGISYTLKGRSDGGLKNRASEKTKWCRYFWHRSVFLNDDVDTAAADDDVEEMVQAAFD